MGEESDMCKGSLCDFQGTDRNTGNICCFAFMRRDAAVPGAKGGRSGGGAEALDVAKGVGR